jgi:hypothetical protein
MKNASFCWRFSLVFFLRCCFFLSFFFFFSSSSSSKRLCCEKNSWQSKFFLLKQNTREKNNKIANHKRKKKKKKKSSQTALSHNTQTVIQGSYAKALLVANRKTGHLFTCKQLLSSKFQNHRQLLWPRNSTNIATFQLKKMYLLKSICSLLSLAKRLFCVGAFFNNTNVFLLTSRLHLQLL